MGSGDFALTEEEEVFVEGIEEDASYSKQDRIEIIPYPNPIFV